jgi:hypothetical protein
MAPLLDMAVTMDRIGFFNPRVKSIMARTSPRIVCSVFFLISCVIGSLIYAQWLPIGVPVGSVFDTNNGRVVPNLVIWLPGNTQFAKSDTGTMFFTVYFFMRESLLLLGEIVPNCVSLFYLKKYFEQKKARVIAENGDLVQGHTSAKKEKPSTPMVKAVVESRGTNVQVVASSTPMATEGVAITSADQVIQNFAVQTIVRLSQADRSATIMALVLCSLSILTHKMSIMANVYTLLVPPGLAAGNLISQDYFFATSIMTICLLCIMFKKNFCHSICFIKKKDDLLWVIKHAANLIIFYSFNKNFKKVFRRYLGIRGVDDQNAS